MKNRSNEKAFKELEKLYKQNNISKKNRKLDFNFKNYISTDWNGRYWLVYRNNYNYKNGMWRVKIWVELMMNYLDLKVRELGSI